MAAYLEVALLIVCILAGHCHGKIGSQEIATSVTGIADNLVRNLCSVEAHWSGHKHLDCGVTVPFFGHVYWGVDYYQGRLYSVYADARVDFGVVEVHLKGRADKRGISGAVGGKVSFVTELEGEVGITEDHTVTGTVAAGVHLTDAAQAKVTIKADTNGHVSAEARARTNLGFAETSVHVGINQDGVVNGGVRSGVKLGEESAISAGITGDTNGHTTGRVDGKLGFNGKAVQGFASMDESGTVSNDASVKMGTARGPKLEL